MQELELNYPTTKGKVYSEEEDRYLLCRLNHYGMRTDDVYERIKKDITEFPVFRFDWFFKSRSPQELQRRCNTLLGMIEKEAEAKQAEERARAPSKSKVCLSVISIHRIHLADFFLRNVVSRTSLRQRRRRRSQDHLRLPVLWQLLQRDRTRGKRHKHLATTFLFFASSSLSCIIDLAILI